MTSDTIHLGASTPLPEGFQSPGPICLVRSQMGLDVGTTDIPFMQQFHAQA